jgi:hypothetical protein
MASQGSDTGNASEANDAVASVNAGGKKPAVEDDVEDFPDPDEDDLDDLDGTTETNSHLG